MISLTSPSSMGLGRTGFGRDLICPDPSLYTNLIIYTNLMIYLPLINVSENITKWRLPKFSMLNFRGVGHSAATPLGPGTTLNPWIVSMNAVPKSKHSYGTWPCQNSEFSHQKLPFIVASPIKNGDCP